MRSVIEGLLKGVDSAGAKPTVFLARDTRPTGPALAAAAAAGAEAIGGAVVDHGLMTTPQLHYLVYAASRGAPHDEDAYFARLARGFAALVATAPPAPSGAPPLAVDCAHGVGSPKLARLANDVRGRDPGR